MITVQDGNDTEAILKALKKAKRMENKPSLIMMQTMIGFGSQYQGTSKVHGAPLGVEDGQYAKASYAYDYPDFVVPEEVYDDFAKSIGRRGRLAEKKWQKLVESYAAAYPEDHAQWQKAMHDDYDIDYASLLPHFEVGYTDASRNTSNQIINLLAEAYPTFLSGAADLASSVKTDIKNGGIFMPESYDGRNLCFGIREFAMVTIMNGMLLHGGVRVAGGGFMVFSDYFKGGLRMSCLMDLPVILPLSHDSIAVGEDGPTHQPVEQLPMLRSMVNMQTIRPCDANETVAAWRIAMETKNKPTAIILTRQNVTVKADSSYENVKHGGYVIAKEHDHLDAILLAAGSEVNLAIDAKEALAKEGIDVRVVSMPSFDLFDAQTKEYRESVLPSSMRKRLSIEMGASFGWHKYVGLDGECLSVEHFGSSAPAGVVIERYGFTVEHVVNKVKEML